MVLIGLALPGALAAAMPQEVTTALPQAKPVGSAKVSFLFWRVFEANLWSDADEFSWQRPLALSLVYRRDFSAQELTDSSIQEMDRLTDWSRQDLATFRTDLAPCMANVGDGDRITAVGRSEDSVEIYLNGQQRCSLEQPGLRRAFFSIWLSQNSKFPEQSRQLLGFAD
tara:strand:- start:328 stop:834 length:507 start_codon:yes stop_codon:yes gene_type:complete